jgi:hypothetical protein
MLDKRGMSAVVTTVIMIGLVIVAVGIVWAVVMGIIEGETEELDYSQMCVGVNLEIENIDCSAAGTCAVTIKRSLGSKTDAINGVGITLATDDASDEEEVVPGNIAVSKVATLTSDLDATKADMRIYVNKTDGTPYWCTQVSSYP